MFHMWDWGFGISGFLMLIFWLFIVAAAVIVIVVVIYGTKQSQGRSIETKSAHDRAMEKARERYASGEINREEFQQMMEDLKE
ncbi:MAG: SHOCT domain-containing protein [Bacteroidales bacterium]